MQRGRRPKVATAYRQDYARDAELLRFCFRMSQFEMKCIVVSDLLGTNILLNRSVLSARIG